MIVLGSVVNFLFPVIIPIGLAVFTALISLLARQPRRREYLYQIGSGYMTFCESFEYREPFWHELSLSIAFAYIAYDIWAFTKVFETSSFANIIPFRTELQLIVISLVLHLVYLSYRTYRGTEKILGIIWFNIGSFCFIMISRLVLSWNT